MKTKASQNVNTPVSHAGPVSKLVMCWLIDRLFRLRSWKHLAHAMWPLPVIGDWLVKH